ncbi:hypothetical protein L596_019439 [Steinernema carpocapsae]|uniref:Uncharacterized protein n=1 Tax=Steinernema carpocapsae TaxID=34508 RepID=A0A4U5MQI6_STECR|nr:hypothetical protein L596_019439 [Steinernema carpocapsae]
MEIQTRSTSTVYISRDLFRMDPTTTLPMSKDYYGAKDYPMFENGYSCEEDSAVIVILFAIHTKQSVCLRQYSRAHCAFEYLPYEIYYKRSWSVAPGCVLYRFLRRLKI